MHNKANILCGQPYQSYPATIPTAAVERISRASNAIKYMAKMLSISSTEKALQVSHADMEPLNSLHEFGLLDGIIVLADVISEHVEDCRNSQEDEAAYKTRLQKTGGQNAA